MKHLRFAAFFLFSLVFLPGAYAQNSNPASVVVNGVSWQQCGGEHGTCSFTGSQSVLYGAFPPSAPSAQYSVNGPYSGSVACDNSTFGDPAYGYLKACYIKANTPTTPSTPTSFTAPALVNPVNPIAYGAKCDGVTDDTAAFQKALNTSDVLAPAGTCVINGQIQIKQNYRRLQCQGTVLKRTTGFNNQMFIIGDWGNPYHDNSIVGCNFVGANTAAPQWYPNDARHWDIPIETTGPVSNFFLAGNSFKQFFGQAMFQTYGSPNGGSGDKIEYNTFASCGYYGPVFDAHSNGYIGHNTMTDCATGVENDNASQVTGNNVIEYNTVTAVYGYGAPDMNSSAMVTGGVAGNADYSTNIVRNNTVSGTSNAQGFKGANIPSRIIIGKSWGEKPAQYLNNTCGTGCAVSP
ncbi:MAG TPA: glycosyl hydrolase family 28-related protein [Trinickia sp.]|uniref:glycosyl hydrolase family 28-related protein n=1 Tax=Trinickia sp. TaxID=2571163 RepID=UPI002C3D44A9|nr:glycosyl hydrolase family 28-related protein [Trinickia sp.]HTI17751.1 glycosyl hydrolase family 28-related protein [Trinickia sp.]